MTTRRQFMLQCSMAAIALPAGVCLGSPLRSREVSLDRLSFGLFRRLVGTRFYFYPGLTPVGLELVDATATEHAGTRQSPGRLDADEFSLIFRGPLDVPLGQDSYPVAHPQIGRFVMFIVPVWGVLAGARYYEAVFNRPANLAP